MLYVNISKHGRINQKRALDTQQNVPEVEASASASKYKCKPNIPGESQLSEGRQNHEMLQALR
jgi:hypothetical protein